MELIKMSSKGQLVVPKDLRKILGLNAEDMFIAYGKDDYVIFKKVVSSHEKSHLSKQILMTIGSLSVLYLPMQISLCRAIPTFFHYQYGKVSG